MPELVKQKYPFQNPSFSLEDRVNDLIKRFTLDEKVDLMCQYQSAVDRLGVKAYKQGTEAAHGMAWLGKATVFPQPIGLACTWDQNLMNEIGSVIGDEARGFYKRNPAINGLTLWAPTVDMERDPRWGRTEEAYGEDPFLTGGIVTGLIKGIQGTHPFYLKAVATLKHFLANNNEENRGECSASIDQRNMNEYYLKAFKTPIVEGKAYSMMTSYNSVNGTPCILNPDVNKIVKGDWEMNGFIVSDAGDMLGIVNDHHYYESYAEAVANAIKSGIDSITDESKTVIKYINEALSQGLIIEKDIDKALKNTFRVRLRLGEFDPDDMNPYSSISESVICSPKHSIVSYKAAQESIVLLKNENKILPLNKDKLKTVAVIGPLADIVYADSYSGTLPYLVTPFQGIQSRLPGKKVIFKEGCDEIALKSLLNNRFLSVSIDEESKILPLTSKPGTNESFDISDWGWGNNTLRSHANKKYVTTDDNNNISATAEKVGGWFVKEIYNLIPQNENKIEIKTWNDKDINFSKEVKKEETNLYEKYVLKNGINEAVLAAKDSYVATVFVGNNPFINGKETIDRVDISLPPVQEELIKAVYNANPNTIVVIIGSYPIAINWENDNIPAIIYSSHGGQELGNAIADVLFGDYSPAGRLNMTWFKSVSQLPDMMNYDIIKGKRTYMYFDGKPLYPFGHGLTYSTFRYSNLKLSSDIITSGSKLDISVEVRNTGTIASDEVIQLYVKSYNSRVKRPLKELKGFSRVHFKTGEMKTVNFSLSASELEFWDVTRERFCLESGTYTIIIGSSSEDIKLLKDICINGETIPHRNLSLATKAENYDDYFGVYLDECKEGGTCVRSKINESWILFDDADFGSSIESFEVRFSNSSSSESKLEIILDDLNSKPIGSLAVPVTGDLQSFITNICIINGTSGIHKVFFRSIGEVNLSWFRFK